MIERKNLELSVRDFGPIARAEIDLRPLTVFVGPSNTGKSYLAILIYALHRFFSRYEYGEYTYRNSASPTEFSPDVSEKYISDLIRWAGAVRSRLETKDVSLESIRLPAPDFISVSLRPFLREIETAANALHDEILRCFGIADVGRLIRHSSRKGMNVSLKRELSGQSEPIEPFKYKFMTNRSGSELLASIPERTPLLFEGVDREEINHIEQLALRVRLIWDQIEFGKDRDFEEYLLINNLAELVRTWIHSPLDDTAHYLPADRTGIMHAHRVAVGSLIRRAPFAGIQREESLPALSGVLADFLRQLGTLDDRMDTSRLRSEHRSELARQIEREILRGAVSYRASVTGYPVFSYKPEGWKEDMPLMNTSSMVSEIASVVLYLRHVVRPGETLIIEEPESHLHPAMQVEFTRQLAAVVRAGVRVIITTHSEWVLDELANLVRLSELPKSRREGIGGANYALTPDQLGVWLFEPKNRPRGSVVKEIPFDEEFGGFRSGFDEVAMGTYNDYAAISNRMERSRS